MCDIVTISNGLGSINIFWTISTQSGPVCIGCLGCAIYIKFMTVIDETLSSMQCLGSWNMNIRSGNEVWMTYCNNTIDYYSLVLTWMMLCDYNISFNRRIFFPRKASVSPRTSRMHPLLKRRLALSKKWRRENLLPYASTKAVDGRSVLSMELLLPYRHAMTK